MSGELRESPRRIGVNSTVKFLSKSICDMIQSATDHVKFCLFLHPLYASLSRTSLFQDDNSLTILAVTNYPCTPDDGFDRFAQMMSFQQHCLGPDFVLSGFVGRSLRFATMTRHISVVIIQKIDKSLSM